RGENENGLTTRSFGEDARGVNRKFRGRQSTARVRVGLSDEHSSGEAGEGVEAEGLGRGAVGGDVFAEVAGDVGAGAGAVADNEAGLGVAVEVADGDPDAAAVVRVAGEEVGQLDGLAGEFRLAGKGEDPRPAAGAAAADEVGEPVAVEVADGDED